MTRNQRFVLVASILGSFVAFLDIAVVNVALPAISRELGGGISAQQWVVDAYLLALGSLILIAGSLADLFGRRRVFAAGLIGFGAASLLCAAAPTVEVLILARGLQGVAGALLVPSSLALIIANFQGPAQGKAIGTWTAWTGISFVLGPLVGGALVDSGSWRWVFAINLLPIAATLAVLARVQREARPDRRTPVDVVGAGLCALGLGGIIFALIERPARGWGAPLIILPLAGGVAAFAAFLWFERVTAHPMLDFALFRSRNFAAGNLATVAIYAGLTASTFLLTVFLQQVARYSAIASGLALLPVTLIMFTLSPVFGRLASRHGPRLYMAVGPVIAAAGFALSTRVDARASYPTQLLPGVIVFGLGLSATVAPLTAAILSGIDERHAGVGSAINNAIARVAGLLAVAAVGGLVATRYAGSIERQTASAGALGAPARAVLEEARRRPLDTAVPKDLPAESAARLKTILDDASADALHVGLGSMAALLAAGGIISAVGIRVSAARRPSTVTVTILTSPCSPLFLPKARLGEPSTGFETTDRVLMSAPRCLPRPRKVPARSRRFCIPALLCSIPFLGAGCGGGSSTPPDGTGGASGTGGATSTGGATAGPPETKPLGYGQNTTGGGSATPVMAGSMAEVQAAIDAYAGAGGLVIQYTGIFDYATIPDPCTEWQLPVQIVEIKKKSDITILGVDGSAINFGFHIVSTSSNIIIRNMTIGLLPGGGSADAISIEGISSGTPSDIWIDHNELFSSMVECAGAGDSSFDGLVDIKKGADNVTVSYNTIHDHHKVSLNGFSDSDTQVRHVTFHHNIFQNIGSRTPLQRGGYSHMLNNQLSTITVTGINVRMGGYSLIEGNYFENAVDPVTSRDSSALGDWELRGNNIQGPADFVTYGITWSASSSTPARDATDWTTTASFPVPLGYPYTVDPPQCLKDHLVEVAGAGKGLATLKCN